MTEQRTSGVYKFIHSVIAMKPVSRVLAVVAPRVDRVLFKITNGRTCLSAILAGLPMIRLTVVGRKSGTPRVVPLIGIQDRQNPTRYTVIASNWGKPNYPAWYHNVMANPQVKCLIRGKEKQYLATEAQGAEYDRLWADANAAYLGYQRYLDRAGRNIPIVILTPID
jgi:deazaflavin-dependent oxidoreductase (nitroreductase family)